MDQQRVQDLESIQWELISYWQDKGELPADLGELTNELRGYTVHTDPVTAEAYSYTVAGDLAFTLCATFDTSSDETNLTQSRRLGYGEDGYENWAHEMGEHCFDRTIDPDIYGDDGVMKEVF